jgi:hypothetical protein
MTLALDDPFFVFVLSGRLSHRFGLLTRQQHFLYVHELKMLL